MKKLQIRKETLALMVALLLGTAACGRDEALQTGDAPTTVADATENDEQTGNDENNENKGNEAESRQPGADEAKEETVGQNGAVIAPSAKLADLVAAVKKSEVAETAARTATVTLNDAGIVISGNGCVADGNRLKIKEAGTYEISGTLSNGSIFVNTDQESEVHLILNGVTVHNETGAALFCKKAAKVTLTLAAGSVNTLTDGAEYVFDEGEDEPDATLYAKHDLVINGSGMLKVTSAYGDAVKGKDSLYILGGSFVINAADDGIIGRDFLYIADGSFEVQSVSDAIKATNDVDAELGNIWIDGGTFLLNAGEDGIQAENTLTIHNGSFSIQSGGGAAKAKVKTESRQLGGWGRWGNFDTDSVSGEESDTVSAKGLKGENLVAVMGGVFDLDTCDDAVHSNKEVRLSGGTLCIRSGDDGVHADESLLVEGTLKLEIIKSYEGLEAENITVSGGDITIVASDDGINAAGGADSSSFGFWGAGGFGGGSGEIVINGGNLTINAAGDGVDSNGNITINGGTLFVYGPTGDGDGVLDYDGSFWLNGGTLLCIGSAGMAQMPDSTSGQYSVAAVLSSAATGGSTVEVTIDGIHVVSAEAPKQFRYILASSADFTEDADVAVLVNGEECYSGNLTETVTCFGTTGGFGGGGFGGGGFGGGGFGGGGFGGNSFDGGEDRNSHTELPEGKQPKFPRTDV